VRSTWPTTAIPRVRSVTRTDSLDPGRGYSSCVLHLFLI
jgi:hypothetical protein